MKVVLMNIRIRVMMLPKSDGQSLRLRYYAGWNMYGALVISSNTLWQHRQLQAISLTDKRTKVYHYTTILYYTTNQLQCGQWVTPTTAIYCSAQCVKLIQEVDHMLSGLHVVGKWCEPL